MAVVPIAAAAQDRDAQRPRYAGVWATVGVAWGGAFCPDCPRPWSGYGSVLAIGGTIHDGLLLGAAAHTWLRTDDGVHSWTGITLVVARLFLPDRGTFVTAGLGLGRAGRSRAPPDPSGAGVGPSHLIPTTSLVAPAGVIGLGHDVPLSRRVIAAPFVMLFTVRGDGGAFLSILQVGGAITFP